ncbi:MarR family winged helix-turn-helix transcriptional regulator [Arthrobacter sp. H41]|uniref:MarR family winged helix-turn-helix transcriptional regulator n=1 Tax=Arthrobacter sp. H41 TaxID=1312978 RepID=UPI00047D8D07|nr:MarR family transcriptional regulator [Arthrobacter sp. H41]
MTDTQWLTEDERTAWIRLAAVLELLPGALDAQLTRDVQLTHFEYFVLAMLSEAPSRTLRVAGLAAQTNATLPRLSRVLTGLEKKHLVERTECSEDRRAKNVTLTEAGWQKVLRSAPGHVTNVRNLVLDQLTPEQIAQLSLIAAQLLKRLDPDARMFVSAQP